MKEVNIPSANFIFFLNEGCSRLILGFLATVIIARELSPDLFGQYVLYLTLSVMGLSLAGLFNKSHLLTHFSGDQKDKYYVSGFWVSQVFSVLVVGVLTLLTVLNPLGLHQQAALFSLLPMLLDPQALRFKWLLSHHRFRLVAMVRISARLLSFVCKMILLYSGFNWTYLLLALFLENCIQTLLLILLAKDTPPLWKENFLARRQFWTFIKESLGLSAVTIVFFVFLQIDTIWLRFFGSFSEVGFYSLSQKLLDICVFFVGVFSQLFLPLLLVHNHDRTFIRSHYIKIVLISVSLSLAIYFLAPLLVPFLFGAPYKPAIPLLQVLSFSLPPLTLLGFELKKYELESRVGWSFILLLGLIAGKLALNGVFYTQQGTVGVVFSSLLCLYPICILSLFSEKLLAPKRSSQRP